jgi:hypothetical protein
MAVQPPVVLEATAEAPEFVSKEGIYEGYRTVITQTAGVRTVHISMNNETIVGLAESFVRGDDCNSDGRFDQLTIRAPKGSPLERFAGIQELQITKIFTENL